MTGVTSGDDLWADCLRNDYALASQQDSVVQGIFFFLAPVFSDCNWHLAFSALASQSAQLLSKFGALDLVLSPFVTYT